MQEPLGGPEGKHGGIGAGRRATGIQQFSIELPHRQRPRGVVSEEFMLRQQKYERPAPGCPRPSPLLRWIYVYGELHQQEGTSRFISLADRTRTGADLSGPISPGVEKL
jgi:hypothetical protein